MHEADSQARNERFSDDNIKCEISSSPLDFGPSVAVNQHEDFTAMYEKFEVLLNHTLNKD